MNSNTILGSLKLWQKFLILSLVAVVLAIIPTYVYVCETAKGIDAYRGEQQGMTAVLKGLKMVQLTQQHRGLSALVLGGIDAAQDRRVVKQQEADASYAEVDAIVKSLHDPAIEEAWVQPKHDWEALVANIGNKSFSVPASYAAHTELVPKLLKVNDLIADHFNLSLDPSKDSYQLIQSIFYQLPHLTEEVGKTRAKGAALLAKKEASPEDRLALATILASVTDRLEQTLGAFNKAATANADLKAKLAPQMKEAASAATKVGALALGEIVKAEKLSYSSEEYVNQATQAIDLLFAFNAAASKELDVVLASKVSDLYTTRWTMLGAMIAMAALAGYLAVLVARSVTVPLGHAIEVAQKVAGGNLINDFDVGGPNEVGQLLRALKEMNDKLRNIVGGVRVSVDTIGAATSDIANGNADISSRLESQASNLEETASSMEELTSTVRQNASNASQANELVLNASTLASKGGGVVSQMVQTMGEIDESSRKIVEIIAVIDGIAFQTNILALNAAVEAARAGEQGRGFAVVASEVRNLAHRSASAAKEIKGLISHSVEKVEIGNRLAGDAGMAMDEILGSVKRITEIMTEIAVASREQASGIEQVNLAVTQMDDMTQQNAALVEQTAAASSALQDQTRELVAAMSVFELGDARQATNSHAAVSRVSALNMRNGAPQARPQLQYSAARATPDSARKTARH